MPKSSKFAICYRVKENQCIKIGTEFLTEYESLVDKGFSTLWFREKKIFKVCSCEAKHSPYIYYKTDVTSMKVKMTEKMW